MARKLTLKEQIKEWKDKAGVLNLKAKRLDADVAIKDMELTRAKKHSADNQLRILTLETLLQEEIAWLGAFGSNATSDRAEYLRKELTK